jgi:hypothetical protein
MVIPYQQFTPSLETLKPSLSKRKTDLEAVLSTEKNYIQVYCHEVNRLLAQASFTKNRVFTSVEIPICKKFVESSFDRNYILPT